MSIIFLLKSIPLFYFRANFKTLGFEIASEMLGCAKTKLATKNEWTAE
jgi:hypothetical protein